APRKLRVKQDGVPGVSHDIVKEVCVGRLGNSTCYGHGTYAEPIGNQIAGVAKDGILVRYCSCSRSGRVVVDADAVSGVPGDSSGGRKVAINLVERIGLLDEDAVPPVILAEIADRQTIGRRRI